MNHPSTISRVLGAVLALAVMTTTGHSVALDRELAEAPDFRVRVQAALRLGRSGGTSARLDLERCLRDSHPAVRVACAVALGNVGDSSSIAALDRAMRGESDGSVKNAMSAAIEKVRAGKGRGGLAADPQAALEGARYVVQLGNMRNNSGVRTGDLDDIMKQAARAKATSIAGVVIVDASDSAAMRRVAERKLPVLLVDGNLSRLTQSAARDGRVIISAQVDLSIRKVPQQTLKGTVSGNASATASATEGSGATQRGIGDLQIRAACSAVESAMSGVSSEIASLAK